MLKKIVIVGAVALGLAGVNLSAVSAEARPVWHHHHAVHHHPYHHHYYHHHHHHMMHR